MKIYLLMCLNDVIGDNYYTDENEVKKLVDEANANLGGGDFWYKTLYQGGVPFEECDRQDQWENVDEYVKLRDVEGLLKLIKERDAFMDWTEHYKEYDGKVKEKIKLLKKSKRVLNV